MEEVTGAVFETVKPQQRNHRATTNHAELSRSEGRRCAKSHPYMRITRELNLSP
jgi:hypothetical protein